MKNNIIGILLIFCCTFVNAQNKDTIVWSKGYKLSWEDFKGRPKSGISFEAISHIVISDEYTYENNMIKFIIVAQFIPKKSWTKSKNRLILLEHEQLHFDIAELYARKLKKKLAETKFRSNPEKIKEKYDRIFDKMYKELNYYQDLYDKETDFSRDEVRQKEWREKVARELEELEEYANPELVIDLSKKRKRKKREVIAPDSK
ncbi:MAG: hypothetical protein KatS3mg035_2190 [Bacteroidia bacterium]|nr:MAG: hypothetical protein KatS3mg035_2136 [Bacteroidia bacterium]GIV45067.1 MAG: hypothetical protein KatS3mg035_2190 [Bacteroidia bacterium]